MLKRLLLSALAALLLAVAVLAGLAWHAWSSGGRPAPADAEPVQVLVAPGATWRQVASILHERGLLEHQRLLVIGARLSGCERRLKTGRFSLPPGASPRDLLRILCRGRPAPVVVTLPEGLEAAALAAILADSLQLDAAAILAAADALIASAADTLMLPAERARLAAIIREETRPDGRPLRWCEGYLAADTFHFAPWTDTAAVVQTVVGLQLQRLGRARAEALWPAREFSPHALLTLASLVEAEARRADERARVAAVYHNRLQKRMRLEADPTVGFWLGKRGERLLYRDLEFDSPYNTYRREGLPPGPLGNPGLEAIVAAARPDTACAALFFVADGDGGHIFSQTLAEHLRAVARYRELMRERRR